MSNHEKTEILRFVIFVGAIWAAIKWKELGHDVRLFLTIFFGPLVWALPAALVEAKGVWLWGWLALGIAPWIAAILWVAKSD